MFEEIDMLALQKILGLPGFDKDPPETFRKLAEDLFPDLVGFPTNKHLPACQLRGRISGVSTRKRFTEFYKNKRMNWAPLVDFSDQDLKFLESVYKAYPQEQQLRRKLANFFTAGAYNKVI